VRRRPAAPARPERIVAVVLSTGCRGCRRRKEDVTIIRMRATSSHRDAAAFDQSGRIGSAATRGSGPGPGHGFRSTPCLKVTVRGVVAVAWCTATTLYIMSRRRDLLLDRAGECRPRPAHWRRIVGGGPRTVGGRRDVGGGIAPRQGGQLMPPDRRDGRWTKRVAKIGRSR